jgi:hypothetical protein
MKIAKSFPSGFIPFKSMSSPGVKAITLLKGTTFLNTPSVITDRVVKRADGG